MTENDVLGFNPQDLFKTEDSGSSSNTNSNTGLVYRMRPADSKDEDHIYRATIKVVYNPLDRKHSFLDQQSYGMQDANGFFSVVSSLTLNTDEGKNCPIFKAWKKCRYAEEKSPLWYQQAKPEDGGKGLFDKRQARYCIVQILEDKNQPDLVGSFKLWKIPASIYQLIKQKQDPTDPKKAAIPVMDYLFGRAIDIEVAPGPGKPGDITYTRQVTYTGELSEDEVQCVNPDGSPLLTSAEQEILETYIEAMKKVWKCKEPEERAELLKEVLADENTATFRPIYARVLEQIKEWAPKLDILSYHEWSDEVKARVQNWIDVVLAGNDPATATVAPKAVEAVGTEKNLDPFAGTTSTAAVETAEDPDSDLPF